VEKFMPTLKN